MEKDKTDKPNCAYNNEEMRKWAEEPDKLKLYTAGSGKIITWKCITCLNLFERSIDYFRSGKRCPYCCKSPRMVSEETSAYQNFEMRIWCKEPEQLKKLSISSNKKIEWCCTKCKSIFISSLGNFTQGRRCPYCRGVRINQTNWAWNNEEMRSWATNPEQLKSVSLKSDKRIEWKCIKCEYIFSSQIKNFANGKRCPKCRMSLGEQTINRILNEYNIENIPQFKILECKYHRPLPFDHAVFKEKKLVGLIEFHGEQHFSPLKFFGGDDFFQKRKKRDDIKRNFCEIQNIPLLIIHYKDDIRQQLQDFLFSLKLLDG